MSKNIGFSYVRELDGTLYKRFSYPPDKQSGMPKSRMVKVPVCICGNPSNTRDVITYGDWYYDECADCGKYMEGTFRYPDEVEDYE